MIYVYIPDLPAIGDFVRNNQAYILNKWENQKFLYNLFTQLFLVFFFFIRIVDKKLKRKSATHREKIPDFPATALFI